MVLDAGKEKLCVAGIVRDVAVLAAVGIDWEGDRCILGVTGELKDAVLQWREFLDGLARRGISGVKYIVSDDHPGLKASRREVFTNARWQRCQFHLTQNVKNQAPNKEIKISLMISEQSTAMKTLKKPITF